ncbi:carbohydrate ABC transporter permease [Litorilinea aerophila]|uniref:carbohydrate ABC transporter permease n=1 Tax=Litorilinea aerophila TaxID=1204385 RepID=UPI001B86BBB6|nr:carbohydrate ABC transporter permease [Litorilinea aerophila]MCC9077447.1 carbohydrate ABC transporter permease [Litorilinea aerophila]
MRYRLGYWIGLILLLLFSFVVLAPFAWVVATSLRTPAESFSVPPQWIPIHPDFSNYQQVFERIPFWKQIFNSFVVSGSIVLGQLTTAALAGYAFAHLNFPGKNVLFWLIMATMMIPIQATIIPVYILMSRYLDLADTLQSLIFPALPTAFGTFLLRQYFLTIPRDYEEAAMIDGANPFQVFYRIYLPLVSGGLAVLAVLSFNGHWNEFFRPLIFLVSKEKFTIPLGLFDLQGYMMTGSISVVLAGIVLSMIPVLLVYLVGQRYLIEGIMMGGLKG